MCFRLTSKRCKIAKKNLKVYKYLESWKEVIGSSRNLTTPYMYFEVEYNKLYELGNKLSVENDRSHYSSENKIIEEGFHAYLHIDHAITKARFHSGSGRQKCLVAEAIIPKGTRYYENTIGEVVSEKIKYTKQLWIEERMQYVPTKFNEMRFSRSLWLSSV